MGTIPPYGYYIRKIEPATTSRIGPPHFRDVHPRLAASLTNSRQVAYPQSSVVVMESSRIPFLEELQLFWKGSVIRKPNGRRDSSDLSAQRIQFNRLCDELEIT